MADAVTADGSLKNEFNLRSMWSGFKSMLHWSHIIMYGSLALGAFAAVSTGGVSAGFFDVALRFVQDYGNMVFGGFFEMGEALDGMEIVSDSASQGDLYTGVPLESGHGGHAVDTDCMRESFNSLTPDDFEAQQKLSQRFAGGDFYGQLEGMCHE